MNGEIENILFDGGNSNKPEIASVSWGIALGGSGNDELLVSAERLPGSFGASWR